eukprot:m.258870 g.258870  ORF g.258870 m.258870 type:complete len:482 (+) comp19653_c0_seq6:227-1672(+)
MLHYLQILILRTEYALFACREAVDRTKSDPKCASSKYQQRSKTAATRTCSRYGGGWSNKKLSVQIDNDVGARCGMSRLSSRYSSGGSDEDTSDGVGSSTTRLQARTCSAGSVDGSMSDGLASNRRVRRSIFSRGGCGRVNEDTRMFCKLLARLSDPGSSSSPPRTTGPGRRWTTHKSADAAVTKAPTTPPRERSMTPSPPSDTRHPALCSPPAVSAAPPARSPTQHTVDEDGFIANFEDASPEKIRGFSAGPGPAQPRAPRPPPLSAFSDVVPAPPTAGGGASPQKWLLRTRTVCFQRAPGEPLGMVVYSEKGKYGTRVDTVKPNSVAERAGMQPEDTFIEVNGQFVLHYTHSELVKMFKDLPSPFRAEIAESWQLPQRVGRYFVEIASHDTLAIDRAFSPSSPGTTLAPGGTLRATSMPPPAMPALLASPPKHIASPVKRCGGGGSAPATPPHAPRPSPRSSPVLLDPCSTPATRSLTFE